MLVLLFLLISRLLNWSGLRISYSKVFSSDQAQIFNCKSHNPKINLWPVEIKNFDLTNIFETNRKQKDPRNHLLWERAEQSAIDTKENVSIRLMGQSKLTTLQEKVRHLFEKIHEFKLEK